MQTKTARAEKAAERKAHKETMDRLHREALTIVNAGRCPQCGAGLRRNLALTGWWQCEQYGSDGFRKDATKPACSGQWFTE